MLQGGHNSQFEIGLVPKTGLEFERIEGSWLAVLEVTQGRAKVPQSRPTRSDPMDCSLPGSSIHGIFQARVLEWLAIVGDFFFFIVGD